MAIFHFSAKVISRATGRSAVAAAAYRAAACLPDDCLGRAQDFRAKAGVVHSEILLPEGAPNRWRDRATLWNEVEATEKRRDAQLARDVEIALPRELSKAEAVALAQDFVHEQFVARGMVADLNVHWGTTADGAAQPHAHVMLTMRRVEAGQEGEGRFGAKAREWNDTELLVGWRERWAELANQRLHELGHEARIDHRSLAAQGVPLEPQHKVGPAGARRAERGEDAERRAEHDSIARRNGERLAADPTVALDALTRQQSTFTRHELARFVSRHTDGAEQFALVMAKVEAAPELVRVGQDGRGRERFSAHEMLATEQRLEAAGAALVGSRGHAVGVLEMARTMRLVEEEGLVLGAEQRAAVRHVTAGRDLALVVGYAGTGKSAMLGVAREVWEGQGYRVRGAALSGIAAEGLEAGSGIKSRTLASLEWGWAEGREADRLSSRDVLVVDEAGMVGSRQLERVLSQAQQAGAKVVLVGDPEQLQAIEAGAAFRALSERHGAAEIAEVRRQRQGWQREATRELATGRTAAALGRYEAAGMVRGHATQNEARAALVAEWMTGRQESPTASQVMLAPTRADVAALNGLARDQLRQAGELGAEHQVATENGPRTMAAGERVMFLRNERALGAGPDGRGGAAVKNGTLGTVLAVEAQGERLTVALDGAGGQAGQGEAVTFYLRDYAHLDHGYAATVHKAQGVTVDRAHVLAGAGMDRHMAYVALTRHREGVSLHWSAEALGDRQGLARALSRERAKDTTLDYDGPKRVAAFAERRGFQSLAIESEIVVRPEEIGPAPKRRTPSQERAHAAVDRALHWHERERIRKRAVAAAEPAQEPGREERLAPLLAAHHGAWGRDSLGRGTSPAEVAAVVEADRWVRGHAERRVRNLWEAYREPEQAGQKLRELIGREDDDLRRAAAVLAQEGPEILGALRGREGWFTTQATRGERVRAASAAQALGWGLESEAKDRAKVAREHVAAVEAQRKYDAVEVPGLSRAAWGAVRAVEAAREGAASAGSTEAQQYWQRVGQERGAAAEAWEREVVAKPAVAAELEAFAAAVRGRFGWDAQHDARLQRPEAKPGTPESERPREGLAGVGRALAAERAGRGAYEDREQARERAHQAEQERLGLRPGRGMRM